MRASRYFISFSSAFSRARSASVPDLSRPISAFSCNIRSRSLVTLSSSWRSCLVSLSSSRICWLREISIAADSLRSASSCSMPDFVVTC
uniref:Putative secreted protein n=1 Tax=Anopheles darlingi TaxID=43151 RepID=A0A2M4D1E9_ANODA